METETTRDRLRAMLPTDQTTQDMARELGVSQARVYQLLMCLGAVRVWTIREESDTQAREEQPEK